MKIYAVADIHGSRERVERIGSHTERLKPDAVVVKGIVYGADVTSPILVAPL